ncbi:MAG: hypothetical protein AB1758_16540, partial [Candidatus Eremiobacterota bacterium]
MQTDYQSPPGTAQQAQVITALDRTVEEDPLTGVRFRRENLRPFSWAWVWMSIGSFLVAQSILAAIGLRMATIHGHLLREVLFNVATYYIGGFMIGVVSPKIRVMEPAVAAVITMFLVMSVGMWFPTNLLPFNLGKAVIMGALVFVV